MNGTKTRKLRIHKETLRQLTADDLRQVAGGVMSDSCNDRTCPLTEPVFIMQTNPPPPPIIKIKG